MGVMSTTGWHTMYLGVVAVLFLQLLHPSTAQVGQEVDMLLCEQRQQDWTYEGRRYVFSGFATDLKDEGESSLFAAKDPSKNFTGVLRDFGNAVRHCTLRCMALVSIEKEGEWEFLKEKMEELRVPFIWTSGHKCDRTVSNRCYSDASLQPRIVNGWFWSGSGAKIPATDKIPPGWSASPWEMWVCTLRWPSTRTSLRRFRSPTTPSRSSRSSGRRRRVVSRWRRTTGRPASTGTTSPATTKSRGSARRTTS